jgi:hypothetical protein
LVFLVPDESRLPWKVGRKGTVQVCALARPLDAAIATDLDIVCERSTKDISVTGWDR